MRTGEAIPRGKINPEEALPLKWGEKNSKMRRKRIEKRSGLTALFYAR